MHHLDELNLILVLSLAEIGFILALIMIKSLLGHFWLMKIANNEHFFNTP